MTRRALMPDVDLTQLPHESWCDLGSPHADCCPGKAEFGCSCITRDVVCALGAGPWTPTEWWQIADREGRIFCQTTSEVGARVAHAKDRVTDPGLILQRLYERRCKTEEWREVSND
jgi:hypothetical protein